MTHATFVSDAVSEFVRKLPPRAKPLIKTSHEMVGRGWGFKFSNVSDIKTAA